MIPAALLSKIDNYLIKFGDAEIRVTALDNHAIVKSKLNELKSSLGETRVVGLTYYARNSFRLIGCLVLCSKDRCLIIKSISSDDESVKQFMADETICFVGLTENLLRRNNEYERVKFDSEVKLGYLAARAMKNHDFQSYGLEQLAAEVGTSLEPKPATTFEWGNVMFFSPEQMKSAIYEAYHTYLVADSILSKQ